MYLKFNLPFPRRTAMHLTARGLLNCLFFLSFIIVLPCAAFQDKPFLSINEIPNPAEKGNGYVSDPQRFMNVNELDSLNQLLAELDSKTGVEAAVVIISDFTENEDDFTFATTLFRKWGIGKRRANNGLLLFITTDRRQYRFITGYGVEGLLPDATLATIGEQVLVPAFKQQAYGRGIISSINIISRYLQQPANQKELNSLLAAQKLEQPRIPNVALWLLLAILISLGAVWQIRKFKLSLATEKLQKTNLYKDISEWSAMVLLGLAFLIGIIIFISGHIMDLLSAIPKALPVIICTVITTYFFFSHLNVLSRLRNSYKDDVNFYGAAKQFYRKAWWHAFLSPILLLFIIFQAIQFKRLRRRIQPITDEDGKSMNRINRDDQHNIGEYLSKGQMKEEEIGSLAYDIWTGTNEKLKLVPNHGYHYHDFDVCPACGFRTYTHAIEITVQRATYTHSGKAKRVRLCRYCTHEQFIEFIILDMLIRSNSSSSSSGSSGSSSSSGRSSSSRSWGGGTTGGGGAGGSW